ncbi:MAG: ABC transporter permease [Woeseiaceae bacterium]
MFADSKLGYDLQLALKSIRKTPILSALMVAAIGIGVGACMTIITLYYVMTANPNPDHSEELFTYALHNNLEPYDGQENDEPRLMATYRDAMNVFESDIPTEQSLHYQSWAVYRNTPDGVSPFWNLYRLVSTGFFSMFDVPFMYGGPWSQEQEDSKAMVMVLTREINNRLFGGEDSVGEKIEVGGDFYEIVGVMDTFKPLPKYFEFDSGLFEEIEGGLVPFSLTPEIELMKNSGGRSCIELPEGDDFQSYLDAECHWIHHWIRLPTPEKRQAFAELLDNYSLEQRRYGRFQGPFNNRLFNLMEFLDRIQVVDGTMTMLIGVSVMFLIVCLLNTNALLFAKFTGRSAEVSIKRALGCSKKRLLKQHLVEIGLVGLVGGALGLCLTFVGLEGIKLMLTNFDNVAYLNSDLIVITVVASIGSTLVAGLYPAWRSCRIPPAKYLKSQ